MNVRLKRYVHPPKHISAKPLHILATYKNVTDLIGLTQETIEITDRNDTKIPTEISRAISEDAQAPLIATAGTICVNKSQVETKTI